ncbi:MAG: hypothetical protein LN412_07405 [Candidatus Thermoplasmatota archaeon]|nr:hypothetical protein [Candidatus Thermoplasmatota archaeon]
MSEAPTWQLLAAVLTAIMGIMLIPAAFSPNNLAPPPAILGSGVVMLAVAFFLLKLHFDSRKGERSG